MTFKEKILTAVAMIGVFFSAVFYVLFQQKKEENLIIKNNNLEEKNTKLQEDIQGIQNVAEKYKQNLAETEMDYHDTCFGNNDAGVQLMHKLSQKGKERNNINSEK